MHTGLAVALQSEPVVDRRVNRLVNLVRRRALRMGKRRSR
jgi:hypothetical protein